MFITIALIFFGISLLYVLSTIERELSRMHRGLKAHVELDKLRLPSDSFEDADPESNTSLQKQKQQLKKDEEELDHLGDKVLAYRLAMVFLLCGIFVLMVGLFFPLLLRSLSSLSFLAILSILLLLAALLLLIFRPASISRKTTYVLASASILASILAGARALARISINPEFTLEAKIDAAINGYFNRQSALGPEHIASINSFFSGRRCPTKEEQACDSVEVQNKLTPIFDRVCRSTKEHPGPPRWIVIIGSTDRVPLRGRARATFESNFGLARARAEWIKTKWLKWKGGITATEAPNCQIPDENFITLGAGPRETGELIATTKLANNDDRGIDIWTLWPSPGKPPEKALDISIKVSDIDLKKKFPLPKTQIGLGTKKQKR